MKKIIFSALSRKTVFRFLNTVKIKRIMKTKKPIKLELGSGKRAGMEGWFFIDKIALGADFILDMTESLPFPDDSVTMIYTSHLLEHLTSPQIKNLLGECRRVLKPGGILSVAVPDVKIYLDAYYNSRELDREKFFRCIEGRVALSPENIKLDCVNYMAYMGGAHHYMFDEECLLARLRQAGFGKVAKRAFDKNLDKEINKHQTIYAQCKKINLSA